MRSAEAIHERIKKFEALETEEGDDDAETLVWALENHPDKIRFHIEELQDGIRKALPGSSDPNPGLIDSNKREIELLRWSLGIDRASQGVYGDSQRAAMEVMSAAILRAWSDLCEKEAEIVGKGWIMPPVQAGVVQGMCMHMQDTAKFLTEAIGYTTQPRTLGEKK
jgi:hypothetical protein